MPRSENLTIMFTDIAGFTARTSMQSRAENAAMLRTHDELLLPLVARFRGRHIKSIGDALLVVFNSPTDAVRCGMAMQDALAEHNRDVSSENALHVRVALNQGEVRVEKGDIFGEPVNIAARIEAMTPAGEVYFSESVYLAMTKAEVPSERMGVHELKGIPEPIAVYRVVPKQGGEHPHGGLHRAVDDGGNPMQVAMTQARLTGARFRDDVLARAQQTLPLMARGREHIARVPKRMQIGAGVAMVVVILAALALPRLFATTPDDVELLLDNGRIAEAESKSQKLLASDADDAVGLLIAGHVAFARDDRKNGVRHYDRAMKSDAGLASDARLVKNLVEALAWVGKPAQDIIVAHPSSVMIDALVARTKQPGYWGRRRAVDALTALGYAGKVDEGGVAIADLKEAPDCSQRLAAVKKIREHHVKAAIPALREVASDGFTNRFKNGCLLNEAQATLKSFE